MNPWFRIDCVDSNQVLGASIDRRKNADLSKIEIGMFKKFTENFKIYSNKNVFANKTIPVNMELVVKVTTNYKLNVVDAKGQMLIPSQDHADEEIHFVRFESLVEEFTLSMSSISDLRKRLQKGNIEFKGWTITDFDRYLFDNPH